MSVPLDFTTPHPLRDEAEYDAAAAEIERLLEANPPKGSPEYERLDFFSILVHAYDQERNTSGAEGVTPQDVVEFVLRQRGMTRADLAPVLGGESRAVAFFEGRRALTIPEIVVLREQLKIPADVLLTPPTAAQAADGSDAAALLGEQLGEAQRLASQLAAGDAYGDERAQRLLDVLRAAGDAYDRLTGQG